MSENEFIDYYELLQLSANADADTIERVFRHLAMKYHPDHGNSANHDLFLRIIEAHRTLSNPELRAGYDVRYQEHWNRKWRLAAESCDASLAGGDKEIRERLLALLYTQRRRSMKAPGLGDHEMSRLLRTPPELMTFHLWYLKAKGWIERLESGHLAITAQGVDQVEANLGPTDRARLIEHHSPSGAGMADQDDNPLGEGE